MSRTVFAYCTTTDGVTAPHPIAITIDREVLLGCGCIRLEGLRPGPQTDTYPNYVHLLTGCAVHKADVGDRP